VAGKTGCKATLTFTAATALSSGGLITLEYPARFFDTSKFPFLFAASGSFGFLSFGSSKMVMFAESLSFSLTFRTPSYIYPNGQISILFPPQFIYSMPASSCSIIYQQNIVGFSSSFLNNVVTITNIGGNYLSGTMDILCSGFSGSATPASANGIQISSPNVGYSAVSGSPCLRCVSNGTITDLGISSNTKVINISNQNITKSGDFICNFCANSESIVPYFLNFFFWIKKQK
jgi:hypothetical protein